MNKYNELIKHMREPTLEENLAIQKNIDKISVKTELNFYGNNNNIKDICFSFGDSMGKITKKWRSSLSGFDSEEDVVEFIFERLNTSDFEDSFVVIGNNGEPNECIKISAEDKREILYDFMMDLVERANKNIVRDNI
jgi:hypothetical protein